MFSPLQALPYPASASAADVTASALLNLIRENTVELVVDTIPPPATGAAVLAKGTMASVAGLDPAVVGDYLVRRTAVDHAVPLMTNPNLFAMFAQAIAKHTVSPMIGLMPSSLAEHYRAEKPSDAWTHPTEFH